MPTIIPDPDQTQDVARRLLAAADDPNVVETDTSGDRISFRVPDEVAAAAGFGDADEPDDTERDVDQGDKPESSQDAAEQGDTADTPIAPSDDVEEPPRSGAGSGKEAWRAFLDAKKIPIPEGVDTRDELTALWDQR
jgi:hypothetical protein